VRVRVAAVLVSMGVGVLAVGAAPAQAAPEGTRTGVRATAVGDASHADRRASGRYVLSTPLKISAPQYYFQTWTAQFVAPFFEHRDALPRFTATLTDVAMGAVIPGSGYETSSSYSDYRGPYNYQASAPLTVGSVYDFAVRLQTSSRWACSIYYSDGCHWIEGVDEVHTWRFTWTGAAQEVGEYVPPPPPPPPAPVKVASTVALGAKKKWGDHGWKITATLRRDGAGAVAGKLTGQWRTGNRWYKDRTWSTSSSGRLTLQFKGSLKKTKYRIMFAGDDLTLPSSSETFFITARR
jgi:hypothetical protein